MCLLLSSEVCPLTKETIEEALGYYPVNGEVGTNYNGIVIQDGDYIEDGTAVQSYCAVCECKGHKLVCNFTRNCEECPSDPEQTCTGGCGDATFKNSFDQPGVHPSCIESSEPCVAENCTTPLNCPGPWSKWSNCSREDDICEKHRYRLCDGCEGKCAAENLTLTQTAPCDECKTTTTAYQCGENEVPVDCWTEHSYCLESCSVYSRNASCETTVEKEECDYSSCKCKNGTRRNSKGECIPENDCGCYGEDGKPYPPGFTYLKNPCLRCECTKYGHKCEPIKDCCEFGPWTDWSNCSKTCGTGFQSRTRERYGVSKDCDNSTIETQECNTDECQCDYEDKKYNHGDTFGDECRQCTCFNGDVSCTESDIVDITSDSCLEQCSCSHGEKVCVPLNISKVCKEAIDNCNNETHEQAATSDPCCPQCVERPIVCHPEIIGKQNLTLTVDGHGLCKSKELTVHQCVGSCGLSKDTALETIFDEQTGKFELYTQSSCKCCRAITEQIAVTLYCEDGSEQQFEASSIGSCSCEECGQK
ncbi:hypothetical protein BsWGS_00370 [Bradybaena similaris]